MEILSEDKAEQIANELKSIVRKYDHRSFIAHIAYLSNIHIRQTTGQLKLRSPVRQIMYLVSLYHSTEIGGKELYSAGTADHKKIIRLLNEIEKGYGYETERPKKGRMSMEDFNNLLITKGTFLNYHLNATLSYVEQDIERIRKTFQHHNEYIYSETEVYLEDYIDFFILLTNQEIERARDYLTIDDEDQTVKQLKKGKSFSSMSESQKMHLLDLVDKQVYEMAIPMEDVYLRMGYEKGRKLMAYFTLLRNENTNYLYYTDQCPYLRKPILVMDGESILMVYSKQLINAIYDFLYDICNNTDSPGRKISERRDLYLEAKTKEVFQDFFDKKTTFHSSYYVNGNEKDLLILNDKTAYIIECKAQKQRTPLRDPLRAYERIKDDFRKSIAYGYVQANEVEKLFYGNRPFKITNKQKTEIQVINPTDYDEVFTIVVTQERLGQIQCDLGLLLNVTEDMPYPWAVCINDLESFLITLKRKQNHITLFAEFLLSRELLHEKVMCYDELELCSYFLFDNDAFVKNCAKEGIFFSQPDMHKFFDLFYITGFGFKDELNLSEKVKRFNPHTKSVETYHNLRPADRIIKFLENNKNQ